MVFTYPPSPEGFRSLLGPTDKTRSHEGLKGKTLGVALFEMLEFCGSSAAIPFSADLMTADDFNR